MKSLNLIIILIISAVFNCYSQVNVELLHQLVAESKSEFQKQDEAKNRQALTSSNEEANRTLLTKLQIKYRELHDRFQILGLAIDATQIGLEAYPIVSEIIKQQNLIFQIARKNPLLLTLAYNTEADLSIQANLLLNYLYGLAISIGDLNQMKSSDRKILFGHVISELRHIAGTSRGLAATMQYSSLTRELNSANPFQGFINQDKQIVDNILQKISILKN